MNQTSKKQRIAELRSELSALSPSARAALSQYEDMKALELYQAELVKLQQHIEKNKLKMLILFEGRDAAGKGSVIGSISRYLNPKHYRIVALGRPTDEVKSQWYFQKFVNHFPSAGEMVLFDRSWYNRAMVEPVFNFCTQEEYMIFMKNVVPFEASLCEQGIVVVKLYFSVSKEVQAKRFEQRRTDPLRQWKLSEIDLQAQEMWDQFTQMKYSMLTQTHHQAAPWHVIRSDNKHLARVETMKLLLGLVEYERKDKSLDYTLNPEVIIPVKEELAHMLEQNSQLAPRPRFQDGVMADFW